MGILRELGLLPVTNTRGSASGRVRSDNTRAATDTGGSERFNHGNRPITDGCIADDQLKYVDQGSGPVVVLIHGLLGAHSNWEPQIETLSRHYRVIALISSDTVRRTSLPATIHSVLTPPLCVTSSEALDIPSATLVGHSLGGGIAMQTLYLFPTGWSGCAW
ncbi:unnamed protein product, partial [Mesorhabditis spiculigera]